MFKTEKWAFIPPYFPRQWKLDWRKGSKEERVSPEHQRKRNTLNNDDVLTVGSWNYSNNFSVLVDNRKSIHLVLKHDSGRLSDRVGLLDGSGRRGHDLRNGLSCLSEILLGNNSNADTFAINDWNTRDVVEELRERLKVGRVNKSSAVSEEKRREEGRGLGGGKGKTKEYVPGKSRLGLQSWCWWS